MKQIICLVACLLAGCAHVDLGQVDYRVADSTVPGEGNNLKSKYRAIGTPIEVDEYYSIELEQAMVGPEISEGVVLGIKFGKDAEMAILANVFELDETGGKGFVDVPDYDAKAVDGKPRLKLVYYGDDLHAGQPFNFSQMPLLGRRRYAGGRVGLQLVIKEIDGESPAVASLLETLAGYGKTVSPVPQVTDVLLDLGTSLMQGSKDDRLLDYRLTLSSGAAILPNGALDPRASLVPGRYVFLKDRQREEQFDWTGIRYDENTGRLLKDGKELRDYLYVVLNISRYAKNSTAENFESSDWTAFRERYAAAAADRTVPLTKLQENFAQMVSSDRSARLKADMLSAWQTVDRAVGLYISRSLKDLDSNAALATCALHKDRLRLQRDLMARRMSDGVRQFLDAYRAANATPPDAEGKPTEAQMMARDKESVISAISSTFMPWATDNVVRNTFASAAAFDTAYLVDGGAATLAQAAMTSANEKAPLAACP